MWFLKAFHFQIISGTLADPHALGTFAPYIGESNRYADGWSSNQRTSSFGPEVPWYLFKIKKYLATSGLLPECQDPFIYFLSRARVAWCLSFDSMLICAEERHTGLQGTARSLWELFLKCLHSWFTQKTVNKHLLVPGLRSALGEWEVLR